jgi:hypothetical protein
MGDKIKLDLRERKVWIRFIWLRIGTGGTVMNLRDP